MERDFQPMVPAKLDFYMQKNGIRVLSFTLYNLKPETLQLLEENTGDSLQAIRVRQALVKQNTNNIGTGPKYPQMTGLHENKKFCSAKETIRGVNRQPQDGRKSLPATLQIRATIQNLQRTPEINYEGNKTAGQQMVKLAEKKVFQTNEYN